MITTSYSVCRGQADHGIGEAGTPIKRGEQYLAADAPLQADPELLRTIRHWLTLDASPGDIGRLQGRLEGWSCFPAGPYYFVVRLGAAGKYDRRDAYFAHGRAWALAAFSADFDPGLYLGQAAHFLRQASAPGAAVASAPPNIEPLAPILAGEALATSLITHLLHGMVTGYPVILAVPVTAFAADQPLARIIGFARGVLPGRLRRRCRIRVFSRNPQGLLNEEPAPDLPETGPVDLLVIPEELAGPALTAVRRRAMLLDERGERRDGPEPAAGLSDYAQSVLASAQRFPGHLTAFGERFDQLWDDPKSLPGPGLTHWVTLTYNLAVALAGGAEHCGSLFTNFLLTQARANPRVPWPALIRPADWARFPQDHLTRFLLRAEDDLSAGERRLQGALVDAFQHGGLTIDGSLTPWWNPSDSAKRRRLLELCDLDPPLIPAARSADLTSPLTIDNLAASGWPLAAALWTEYRAGQLGTRQGESRQLLAHLDQPGLVELLLEADRTGVLAAPWRCGDLAALPLPQVQALTRRLLQDPLTWVTLDDLPALLFSRLQVAPAALEAIATDLQRAIAGLDPGTHPVAYLDLATQVARTSPAQAESLGRRFWEVTQGLAKTPDPAGLLTQVLAGRWGLLGTDQLFAADGCLQIRPTAEVAAPLLGQAAIADRLNCRDLVALGAALPEPAGPALAVYYRRLDTLMRQEPEQTTARLIQSGAWLAWRRHADPTLDSKARRRLALGWITSAALDALRADGARVRPPQWRLGRPRDPGDAQADITRETWNQVLADLGDLTRNDLRLMTQPDTHWPWIHPFQEEQIRDLVARCPNLHTHATLAAHQVRICTRPHDGRGAQTAETDWIAGVIIALADGDHGDSALTALGQRIQAQVDRGERRAAAHGLFQLWQALCILPDYQRRRADPLIANGWPSLQRALGHDRACYDWAEMADGRPILPLVQVAAILQPDQQAGTLGQSLIYRPDCAPLRQDPRWWEALIGTVLAQTAPPGSGTEGDLRPRLYQAEATRQAALALIEAERDALPEVESLALDQAWQALGSDPIWSDPSGAPDP